MKHLSIVVLLFVGVAVLQEKSNAEPSERDQVQTDAMAGRKLTAGQVADLEAVVAKNPDDLSARTKLLGYYFLSRHAAPAAKDAYTKHVLWIIKNQSAADIAGTPYCTIDAILDADAYHNAKQLWLDQAKAHAKNATVLGHAAQFLFLHDPTVAEDLLKQAVALEPKNPEWSDRLAHLYVLQRSKESASKALVEFEKAQVIDTSEESKFSRLDSLAKTAYEAGEIDKASRYSEELLQAATKYPTNWNYGNSVHHGNNVLGRIALQKGDVKQADEFLLKAGQTPGSPQLDSFGPNMSLARELLEAGEKETVLQYFESCRKFWALGGNKLDDWKKQVNAGLMPEFGANLIY